jgi:hypothetical protein
MKLATCGARANDELPAVYAVNIATSFGCRREQDLIIHIINDAGPGNSRSLLPKKTVFFNVKQLIFAHFS